MKQKSRYGVLLVRRKLEHASISDDICIVSTFYFIYLFIFGRIMAAGTTLVASTQIVALSARYRWPMQE